MRRYRLILGVRFFFFFSSRRRHTRFKCDWSSDVCSSDLSLSASMAACSSFCTFFMRMRLEWKVKRSCGRSVEWRSEEHTSELQSHLNLVCRLLLEKKNIINEGYEDEELREDYTAHVRSCVR